MRSASDYKQLGIPTWYHEHARYYERLFSNLGWSEKQVTEALKFGAEWKGGTEQELISEFKWKAAYLNAPDVDLAVDVGLGLRDNITLNGLESLPALEASTPRPDAVPDRQAAAPAKAGPARLEEIRELMRNDPDKYNASKPLQAEMLSLIEASLPDRTKGKGGYVDPGLADIQQIRRDDPDRYFSDPAMQATERRMIDVKLGNSPSASDYPSEPTSAPAPAAPQGSSE